MAHVPRFFSIRFSFLSNVCGSLDTRSRCDHRSLATCFSLLCFQSHFTVKGSCLGSEKVTKDADFYKCICPFGECDCFMESWSTSSFLPERIPWDHGAENQGTNYIEYNMLEEAGLLPVFSACFWNLIFCF